jgi:hypothetical protein
MLLYPVYHRFSGKGMIGAEKVKSLENQWFSRLWWR